jgi:hypothetical protein
VGSERHLERVRDDHWWPSVRTAERYFEVNMGWRVVPGAFDHGTVDQETGRARVQALRLPDPPFDRHSSASSRSEVARALLSPRART